MTSSKESKRIFRSSFYYRRNLLKFHSLNFKYIMKIDSRAYHNKFLIFWTPFSWKIRLNSTKMSKNATDSHAVGDCFWKFYCSFDQEWSKDIAWRVYFSYKKAECDFNPHAGGMAVPRLYGYEIDFVRNCISGSAGWFFVIILEFIVSPIFEIKIHVKKFLDTKKISFSKSDFHKPTYIS